MRELGTSDKLLFGVQVGVRGAAPKIITSMPLDCKKAPFLSIKVYLFLDRIGYLLYDIIH